MPKTPESGGIPLPPSWPPFHRDTWEDRARCLLESLSRMGHEHEEYAMVPMAVNSSKKALAAAERLRVESSISRRTSHRSASSRSTSNKSGGRAEPVGGNARGRKIKEDDEGTEETAKDEINDEVLEAPVNEDEQGAVAGEEQQHQQDEDNEGNEEEDENRRRHHVEKPVKPTKALKTYEQRRKYLTKAMDLHRRTIGGGRSGRRGRAECVAFLRYVLEVLDEQYEEALAALGGGEDDADSVEGGEEEEEDVSSSEEEDEEEEEQGDEEVEEEENDEKEMESSEGQSPKSRQQSKAAAPAPASAPQQKRGPGRPPRSSLSPATPSSSTTAAPAANTATKSSSSSSSPPKSKAARVVINEQDFFDQHNDLCEVCNKPGEVLCCATCNLVFHVRCARPRLRVDPPDDWKCAYCWESGVMGGRKGGKERRRAAIACREMERMRREIREARERRMKDGDGDGDDEEDVINVESEEEEEGDEAEEDEVEETSGPATLAQAAAAGCRKCARELETGEKTSRTHDDICPRKWKGVGKRPFSGSLMNEGEGHEDFSGEEEDDNGEDEEGDEGEDEDSNSPSAVLSSTRDGGMVSLEVAAAAGCIKCQKELETGEKTRKTHVDHCPRKYRGAYMVPTTSSSPPPPAGLVEVDSESQNPLAMEAASIVVKASEPIAESDASAVATTPAQPRRKVGRPPSAKKVKSASSTNTKEGSNPSSHSPPGSATLAEAAAAGCIKCQKELATGEKTRKTHSDDCPRKWKAAGRPPTGTPSPASAEAALARQQEAAVGNAGLLTVVEVGGSSSSIRSARFRGAPSLVDASDANPPDSTRLRRGKRTHDNFLDASSTDTTTSETDEAVPAKRVKVQENEKKGVVMEEESSAIAAIVDLAKATSQGHKEGQPRNEDGSEEKDIHERDEGVLPLRGGGEAVEDMTSEASLLLTETAEPLAVANDYVQSHVEYDVNEGIGSGGWDQTVAASNEMDFCELPTFTPNNDDECGDLSVNTSRVQRSRKKPELFSPTNVADSKWTRDGDNADSTGAGTTSHGPEPLRGGARPKKEDTASHEPVTTTPKRGRPPTKQTKKGGANKKNAKRAPIKKETNDSIAGVGILNRKPGSLFDCSACLDLSKIHICCYCACRLCFNKFGKEQTILCDKCDQEYHTFCLGLDKIPDEEWECPACIDSEKKKIVAEQRKKEREAKKKIEEEKRKEEEAKKEVAAAKRRVAYQERKKQEEESRKARETSSKPASNNIMQKRGPGRPPKSEMMARIQAEFSHQNQQQVQMDGQPQKRGRGRPRKDGGLPIPRKLQTKSEISTTNMYIDTSDSNVERSRSGRKIQRTVFHDEVAGGGLMKRARTDNHGGAAASASRQASIYLAERSAAAAAKSAIAGANASGAGKKEPRRKPGARECMQISRKFGTDVIDQKYFDVLMDYSKRAKVDHLIRMRERLDEHSRFLESQLAGLEALVKKNGECGEWEGKVPGANPEDLF